MAWHHAPASLWDAFHAAAAINAGDRVPTPDLHHDHSMRPAAWPLETSSGPSAGGGVSGELQQPLDPRRPLPLADGAS
jgi:hypothetical protein